MLVVLYSISRGTPSAIPFDKQQELEILMTLGQSLIGMLFLINMELAWWEASVLFGLFVIQFGLSPIPQGPGLLGFLATHIHAWVTYAYLAWSGVEIVRMIAGKRHPEAFRLFAVMWRTHVRR
jgi:cation:H+ antiporter